MSLSRRLGLLALLPLLSTASLAGSNAVQIFSLAELTGSPAGPLAVRPDGTVVVAAGSELYEVRPSGSFLSYAVFDPESGESLMEPVDLQLEPSGSVVVGGFWDVFRVAPDGTATLILGPDGDGAGNTFSFLGGLGLGPEGVLAADEGEGRVFRVAPDGAVSLLTTLYAVSRVAPGPLGGVYLTQHAWPGGVFLSPAGALPEDPPLQVLDETGNGAGLEFLVPRGIASDGLGSVYVAGRESDNLLRLSEAGEVDLLLEGRGDGDGVALDDPFAMAVAPDGDLVVLSLGNDSVLRVAPDGAVTALFQRSAGGFRIAEPLDLAIAADGAVYVAGGSTGNVLRIAPDGAVTEPLSAVGDGVPGNEVGAVSGLALGTEGDLFACGDGWIYRVDPSGAAAPLVPRWALSGCAPMVPAPDGGVYASGGNRVYHVARDGSWQIVIDYTGGGGANLQYVSDLVVGSGGELFVADSSGSRVFRVDPDGTIGIAVGPAGDGAGHWLSDPQSLGMSGGDLYVGGEPHLLRVTPGGTVELVLRTEVAGSPPLQGRFTLALAPAGELFVAGRGSENVVRRSTSGALEVVLDRTGAGAGHRLDEPDRVVLDAAGNAFVSAIASDNVFRITPEGHVSQVIGPEGDGVHRLDQPSGLALGADGVLYVSGAASQNVFRVDLSKPCADGIDNDADGLIDYGHDPGCADESGREAPACDDGLDNDGDGRIDWDGGPAGGMPDAECQGLGWRSREGSGARCGLGIELCLLAPLAARLQRGRRRRPARN